MLVYLEAHRILAHVISMHLISYTSTNLWSEDSWN